MNIIDCTNNTKIIMIIIIQKIKDECLLRLECLPQNPSVSS